MEPAEGTRYGRSSSDWEQLTAACRTFLVEQARKGRDTSYTELNAVLSQRTTARTSTSTSPTPPNRSSPTTSTTA